MNPLLEPNEELAPENIRFRLLYIPPWTLEVTQQQMHAKTMSNSIVGVTSTSRSLFIGLSRRGKLGKDLEADGELVPPGQGRVGCETLSNEV